MALFPATNRESTAGDDLKEVASAQPQFIITQKTRSLFFCVFLCKQRSIFISPLLVYNKNLGESEYVIVFIAQYLQSSSSHHSYCLR